MCVIFFYANSNPAPGCFKLILASNRDEFYHRDTRNVSKWKHIDADGLRSVYGGIDLEPGREGGTWLAIGGHSGVFKVGALLNLTGEPKPRNAQAHNNNIHYHFHNHKNPNCSPTTRTPPAALPIHDNHSLLGRGMIVSDFVTSTDECSVGSYNRDLVADCEKYSAFNFVSIEIGGRNKPAEITLCSNVPPTLVHYDEDRCYGFGNSLPAVPFEKVQYGQTRFEEIVAEFHAKREKDQTATDSLHDELVANLKSLLKCKEKFWPDAELKRRAPNWGEGLSALNVNIPDADYGSRTHTIILVDGNDKLHFIEDTMATLDPHGEWTRTHIVEQFFQKP